MNMLTVITCIVVAFVIVSVIHVISKSRQKANAIVAELEELQVAALEDPTFTEFFEPVEIQAIVTARYMQKHTKFKTKKGKELEVQAKKIIELSDQYIAEYGHVDKECRPPYKLFCVMQSVKENISSIVNNIEK